MNKNTILSDDFGDSMRDRYLTFVLGNEAFGIEIRFVSEIISIQPINFMPEVPEYIKGVVNLRGKVFPVIDMRLKFRMNPIPYTERTCIILVDAAKYQAGLIVDSVAEVLPLTADDIAPPPAAGKFGNRYISGIGKKGNRVTLLLDCEKMFTEEEAEQISSLS